MAAAKHKRTWCFHKKEPGFLAELVRKANTYVLTHAHAHDGRINIWKCKAYPFLQLVWSRKISPLIQFRTTTTTTLRFGTSVRVQVRSDWSNASLFVYSARLNQPSCHTSTTHVGTHLRTRGLRSTTPFLVPYQCHSLLLLFIKRCRSSHPQIRIGDWFGPHETSFYKSNGIEVLFVFHLLRVI